ncbi:MAG: bifunctional pyr operon transcriptional regulator/uracil phosphoribosyltransferase PyrR [bacterium]|nr:bifunctional pyr operon transcriptional regulator/uracil phosphoribosyltransferase PyrR [bacterium]
MDSNTPSKFRQKAVLMTPDQMARAFKRMTHEILERNESAEDLVIMGIRRRGVPLAERIAAYIKTLEGVEIEVGSIDITFYRDDLHTIGPQPRVGETSIPGDITNRTVILVDDVLHTGRTVRSAITELMDYGRPAGIQLAVMIDRGHRELPIRADFVGKNVPTSSREAVKVRFVEIDDKDAVLLGEVE